MGEGAGGCGVGAGLRLMERLRLLWEEDRKAERDGVWLPDALDRKYPNAGREWGWPRKWLRQRGLMSGV